jgi:geranylgeranyl pyrophosphate synthase
LRRRQPAAKSHLPGSLLGLEASRRRARELVEQGLEHLQPFGAEADLLRFLAQYIVR